MRFEFAMRKLQQGNKNFDKKINDKQNINVYLDSKGVGRKGPKK
jgi:hypothetical protein